MGQAIAHARREVVDFVKFEHGIMHPQGVNDPAR
jgi:hypothetical protein